MAHAGLHALELRLLSPGTVDFIAERSEAVEIFTSRANTAPWMHRVYEGGC